MRFMVLGEQNTNLLGYRLIFRKGGQFSAKQSFQEQLFFQPDGHRNAKGSHASWSKREIGLEKSFKLEKRFFVEDDVVQIGQRNLSLTQTILDRMRWKAGIMLLTCKAFLLGSTHNVPVLKKACGTVVVVGRQTKY